ncbi:GNAT family N-acetyltransferase [Altibacter sp. HG106]|uniref:GNAT family N-acetyltransferase n=1 Tax=Altibacter sp. HG106 TaxID=3023937 RepID=UPI00234FD697|nr:GNAT family N-acetyltransferase [Altibacter sp. HG106]MDC7995526.1 GNAT family N-acetyltransferase [Altibacter sp. HG106]
MKIIPFDRKYKQSFYDLNIEWLRTYFYVEPFDEEVLSKPEAYILDKGGHIFFVLADKAVVGTVALMPYADNVLELTKMAVSPEHRGQKIGQHLLEYTLDFARSHSYEKLILYSNTRLENAIYLYRKYGFVEIPQETNVPYERSNIKMELVLS